MNESSNQVVVESLSASDYDALEAASSRVAVVELGVRPTLKVSGPDRATWLNGLLTCDVQKVGPGHGTWGLLLDRLGKIQAVLGVLADGEHLYLAVFWGDSDVVMRELDARLVMEDAELTLCEKPVHWRLWVGPDATAAPTGATAFGEVSFAKPCMLAAFDDSTPSVGAVPRLSSAAWHVFRVRHGLPWGGIDFDDTSRPHEAGLERRAVSWSKGCYLGQEVVCMQDMRGKVKRSVRAFLVRGAEPATAHVGSEVRYLEKVVGTVTTAVYDVRQGCFWIFARVALSSLAEATPVDVTSLRWLHAPGDSRPLETIESPLLAQT
jgi:folate-binding protein YgfZ